jgi:hypothetical protein
MPRTVVYDPPEIQAELRQESGAGLRRIDPVRRARKRVAAKERAGAARADAGAGGSGGGGDGAGVGAAGGGAGGGAGTTQDDYFSRIAKYVPAEMITVTVLGFAAFEPKGSAVVVWLVVGAIANCVYLLSLAIRGPEELRPPVSFYVLSVAAFWMWSLATLDEVGAATGWISDGDNASMQKAFVLAAAAFIIPALDPIVDRIKISLAASG